MYDRFYYDRSTPLQGCGRSFMDFRHVHSTRYKYVILEYSSTRSTLESGVHSKRMIELRRCMHMKNEKYYSTMNIVLTTGVMRNISQ